MTVHRLHRRLDAIRSTQDFQPWCIVFANDGDDPDEAVARHKEAGECKPESGGHWIVQFIGLNGR